MSVVKLLLNLFEVTEGVYNKSDGKQTNKDQIKDAALKMQRSRYLSRKKPLN